MEFLYAKLQLSQIVLCYSPMDKDQLDKLRYPTGKFKLPEICDETFRKQCITALKELPDLIFETTKGLSEEQLDTPYRQDGWNSKQIVHHLADSHMNSFIRFKLALNEDNPTIKPYEEAEWAKGPDYQIPISSSLGIIEGVHRRLVALMEHMDAKDFERTLFHPEKSRELTLDFMAGLYAWHGRHHATQISQLKERKSW